MVHQLWTTAAAIVFDPIIKQSIETDKQAILGGKLFTLSRDNTQQRSLTLSCISSNNNETKFLACVKLYSIKKKKSQAKQVKKKGDTNRPSCYSYYYYWWSTGNIIW